jgi:hypothetical protein
MKMLFSDENAHEFHKGFFSQAAWEGHLQFIAFKTMKQWSEVTSVKREVGHDCTTPLPKYVKDGISQTKCSIDLVIKSDTNQHIAIEFKDETFPRKKGNRFSGYGAHDALYKDVDKLSRRIPEHTKYKAKYTDSWSIIIARSPDGVQELRDLVKGEMSTNTFKGSTTHSRYVCWKAFSNISGGYFAILHHNGIQDCVKNSFTGTVDTNPTIIPDSPDISSFKSPEEAFLEIIAYHGIKTFGYALTDMNAWEEHAQVAIAHSIEPNGSVKIRELKYESPNTSLSIDWLFAFKKKNGTTLNVAAELKVVTGKSGKFSGDKSVQHVLKVQRDDGADLKKLQLWDKKNADIARWVVMIFKAADEDKCREVLETLKIVPNKTSPNHKAFCEDFETGQTHVFPTVTYDNLGTYNQLTVWMIKFETLKGPDAVAVLVCAEKPGKDVCTKSKGPTFQVGFKANYHGPGRRNTVKALTFGKDFKGKRIAKSLADRKKKREALTAAKRKQLM